MNVVEKIQEFITDFITDMLSEFTQSCLIRAGNTISDVIDIMGDNITKTPASWNSELYTKLEGITNAAVMPIAIGIMAIILCYDLISACMDSNNMKDFDTAIFFRFAIKGWVAIYFMNHVFTICSAFFDIGSSIAKTAMTDLFKETTMDFSHLASTEFKTVLSSLSIGDLALSSLLSCFVYLVSMVVMIIVLMVTTGRIIEALIYFCAAPIPFATMTNNEWKNVGYAFLKNILALALQAFFIVVVLAIYEILFTTNVTGLEEIGGLKSLSTVLLKWICYSIICCFMLLKTGSISKSICATH